MAEETGITENWKPLSRYYFCPSPKIWRGKKKKKKKREQAKNIGD